MEVSLSKENADGSAVFTFNMTPEETKAMIILGLKTAILAGIEDAKKWDSCDTFEQLQEANTGFSD